MRLKSNRDASRLILLLPRASKLQSFNIGSQTISCHLPTRGVYKSYLAIYLNGIYDRSADLILNFEDYTKEIEGNLVADVSTKLLGHLDELYQARKGIFSPVHRGDQACILIENRNLGAMVELGGIEPPTSTVPR